MVPKLPKIGTFLAMRTVRAYAMPSVPVPPITLLTDMVARCRLLAAHGARSCLSVRTQPLTATGAPSQTSTIPYHTIHHTPYHAVPYRSHCHEVMIGGGDTGGTLREGTGGGGARDGGRERKQVGTGT